MTGGLALEHVCAYATDTQLYWQVTNNNATTVSFTWQSPSSGESGSGVVAPNSVGYFTTSLDSTTVQIYVNGVLLSEADAGEECLVTITPAYVCTEDNQIAWIIFNDNDIPVGFNWILDNVQTGSGTVAARGSAFLTYSALGEHTLVVTWEIPPVGSRSVTLTTSVDSCVPQATATATLTNTPILPSATFTATAPAPTATLSPTATVTQTALPTLTFTFTATVTQTAQPTGSETAAPPILPTGTFTPTVTATLAPTNTLPPVIATNTIPVQPEAQFTFTPTASVTLEQPTATGTASATATTGVTTTATGIVPPTGGETETPVPSETPAPTGTATSIPTMPVPQATATPVLIPETGVDLSRAGDLALLSQVFVNLGMLALGIALLLSGAVLRSKK